MIFWRVKSKAGCVKSFILVNWFKVILVTPARTTDKTRLKFQKNTETSSSFLSGLLKCTCFQDCYIELMYSESKQFPNQSERETGGKGQIQDGSVTDCRRACIRSFSLHFHFSAYFALASPFHLEHLCKSRHWKILIKTVPKPYVGSVMAFLWF